MYHFYFVYRLTLFETRESSTYSTTEDFLRCPVPVSITDDSNDLSTNPTTKWIEILAAVLVIRCWMYPLMYIYIVLRSYLVLASYVNSFHEVCFMLAYLETLFQIEKTLIIWNTSKDSHKTVPHSKLVGFGVS